MNEFTYSSFVIVEIELKLDCPGKKFNIFKSYTLLGFEIITGSLKNVTVIMSVRSG